MIKRILFILIAFALFGCEKWDLERDNPLDNNVAVSNNEPADITYKKYEVYSDDNNDGLITKGETVELKVYLKNIGGKTANAVDASFSTTSPYASVLSNSYDVSYGNMASNDEVSGQYYYYGYSLKFKVSNSTPVDTDISFSINITDEDGHSWQETFSITVQSINSNIVYSKNQVYSDDNNDGYINKGETIELKVFLKNTGTSTANAVEANFTTTSSYASILSNSYDVSYGNMTANYEASGQYYYYGYSLKFKVSNSTPDNTVITFKANITDEAGNTWTDTFTVTVTKINSTIVYSKNQIYSDNNNNNNQINAGETIELKVFLKNTGTSTANAVSANFSTSNQYITITSTSYDVSYGNMAANYETSGQYYYYGYSLKFNVAGNAPYGTQATINIAITDEFDNEWNDSFTITIY